MTVGLAVELLANLVQQVMLFGFLYLFFDKPYSKTKNIIFLSLFILAMFSMENYFSFHEMTFVHLDTIIIVVSMILYSIICLRGAVYLRIIMPLVVYGLNMIVSFSVLFSMTYLGNKTLEESVAFSTSFRYLYIFIVDLIYFLLLWIILRVSRKKLRLSNIYDVLAFIIVPVLCMVGMYVAVIIYEVVDFNWQVFPLVMVVLFVLTAVSILIWLLLVKTSKQSELKAENIILQKEQQYYQNEIKNSDEYIRQVASIKHDIKNKILCIEDLINKEEYAEALSICEVTDNSLSHIELIRTNNIFLNSILNVIRSKANENEIDLKIEIKSEMTGIDGEDVIVVIGNLCDNAIEYLIGKSLQKMSVQISEQGAYYIITVKNEIEESVLMINPELTTRKDNVQYHGYGLSNVRSVADKYNGCVDFSEKESMFISKVMLAIPNIT